MQELIYPSKGFLRHAQTAINRGEALQVKVAPGWRKKILSTQLPELLESFEKSEGVEVKKFSWRFFLNLFLIMQFFTACAYAKTGGYKSSYSDNNELIINFEPPKRVNGVRPEWHLLKPKR